MDDISGGRFAVAGVVVLPLANGPGALLMGAFVDAILVIKVIYEVRRICGLET